MKNNKILISFIFIIIILLIFTTTSFAGKYTPDKFDIVDSDTEELKTAGGKIVGIIQIVGTAVSVGMIMIIGIKYVLGSAEEKASYKKSLLPYFIGAVLIFGATNLAQVIYLWTKDL